MKFFQLRITLGLALGESWPLLAQPQKNTDVYKGLLAGKAFLSKPAKIIYLRRKQGCHGNEHHGIDPNMLRSGHFES